jgi:phage N-6-adenine-methyltransferase
MINLKENGEKGLFTSKTYEWTTPKWLFDELSKDFDFDCDVCANDYNSLCKYYFTEENTCLDKTWHKTNFMNPPYGYGIGKFIKKAYDETKNNGFCTVAVLPARTDTKWFHNYIYGKADIIFVKGRLKFGGGKDNFDAPFPSMLVFWGFDKSVNSLMKRINSRDINPRGNIIDKKKEN